MKSNRKLFHAGCIGALSLTFGTSSFAQDATCTMLLNAMSRGVITPYHSYFTMKLGALGGKSSSGEKINTGAVLYDKDEGKWQRSEITPQEEKTQMEENRKTSKVSCKYLKDEVVDGVNTSLYAMHEDGDGGSFDVKIWIAKSNGLPAHEAMTSEAVSSDTRFVYGAVATPNTN